MQLPRYPLLKKVQLPRYPLPESDLILRAGKGELKDILASRDIDYRDCCEKQPS